MHFKRFIKPSADDHKSIYIYNHSNNNTLDIVTSYKINHKKFNLPSNTCFPTLDKSPNKLQELFFLSRKQECEKGTSANDNSRLQNVYQFQNSFNFTQKYVCTCSDLLNRHLSSAGIDVRKYA